VRCSTFNWHRPAQTVQTITLQSGRKWASLQNHQLLFLPWTSIGTRERSPRWTAQPMKNGDRAPEVSASYVQEWAQHWYRWSHPSVISVHPQSLELYWLNVKIYYLNFAIKEHLQYLSSAAFSQHLLISHSVNSETGT